VAQKRAHRILVVDDEPDAVEFVKAVLEEEGYRVQGAGSFEGGLAAARAQVPDLIILDVQMPGVDGFSGFAQMKTDPRLKSVPVVMLTGVGKRLGVPFSARDMGDYVGEEPAAYIEKPVEPAVLAEAVRRILGG